MSSDVVLSSRRFQRDGFTVIVEHIYDETSQCPRAEDKQKSYSGCTNKEKAEYYQQDKRRYKDWRNDGWRYMGVSVRILKSTATNWADGGFEVGRASVWGIESDSESSYIRKTEEEEISEAFSEVKRLKEALCGQ